jgi:Tfp pilus assembly protein PilF
MTPEQVDKLITFGKMAFEQGWYDKAGKYFEQALALDASNREAMRRLARVNEILSRQAAAAVEPIEAETRTEPPVWTLKKLKEHADKTAEREKLAAEEK